MRMHGRAALLALGLAALLLIPASAGAKTATKHHLDMYKAEQHITLGESESGTYTLSCPNGDIAADGMWRIDEVGPYNPQLADPDEAPWNIATGVSVLGSYPSGNSQYTFRFRNNTSEDAQLKIWVTCLGKTTSPDTHGHSFVVGNIKTKGYGPLAQQDFVPSNNDIPCAADEVYIAPGWNVTAGNATPFSSYPEPNLSQWSYGFYVTSPNTALTVYGRCLKYRTGVTNGHLHKLYAEHRNGPVEHFNKGNSVWEHQISCGEHQKGLVGGWSMFDPSQHWNNFSWYFLGMDPRIKTRAYKTFGTGAGGQYFLVCVNDRTSRPLSP